MNSSLFTRHQSTLFCKVSTSLLCSLLILLASCKDGPMVKPSASGRPYEVLVVIDEELQKGPVGQAIDSLLTTDIIGLPGSESFAALSHVSRKNLTGAMKYFRNILYIDIDANIYTRTSVRFSRDENANGQYIIVVHSPSSRSLREYCEARGRDILNIIARGELKRSVAQLKKKHSRQFYDKVKEAFDCDIYVPVELSRFRSSKDFLWAATPDTRMNICVYSYNYEGPHTFTKDYVLGMRDSVMKANIPGEYENDYMSTNHEMTESYPITVKGDYCMESRGLWEMSVAYFGGPFVSHSRVDTINNRVIVAEGFVMEFQKLNRTMMRTLESALWTLNLPAATEEESAEKEIEEGTTETEEQDKTTNTNE